MARANRSTSANRHAGLPGEASLKRIQSELRAFFELPPSLRRRLEALAREAKPDRKELQRVYRLMPPSAAHALTFIRGLDGEDLSKLCTQLGHRGKDLLPQLVNFLIMLLPMRRKDREALIGDLQEEYRTSVLPRYGPRKAQQWNIEQLLWSALSIIPHSPRDDAEAQLFRDFKQMGSDLEAAVATSKSIARKLAEINRTSLAFRRVSTA
jgi:hypothetical protein